ncbi:MAG: hypothetical protein CL920_02520 [Deltaproteobacteria bacterium]|nr:hypothetical protein [Deltaproteobacteria bacterium]
MRRWLYFHLATLLVLPPFLIGSVHVVTLCALAIWASLFAILVGIRFAQRKSELQRIFTDGWFWLFVGATCYTIFQYMPLPQSLLSWLSPGADLVYQKTLGAFGLYGQGQWASISLAPGDTAAKIIRNVGFLVLFFGVLQWSRKRRHLEFILKVSVLAATALALLTILQTVLRVYRPLLGLYTPKGLPDGLLMGSPFINSNHLGGYLLLHALLCMCLLHENTHRMWGRIWFVCLSILSTMVLLTLSRGAVFAFVFGSVGFLWLVYKKQAEPHGPAFRNDPKSEKKEELEASRSSRRSESKNPFFENAAFRYLVFAFVIAGGLAAGFGSELIAKEFKQTNLSMKEEKLSFIYQSSAPLLSVYGRAGVGQGAMAMAWHRFSTIDSIRQGQMTITHAESILLQPLIDWGWLVGLLFLCGAVFLMGFMWLHATTFLQRGVLLALIALLAHNLVDFNIEFAGVGFPFLILLASVRRIQMRHEKGVHKKTIIWNIAVGVVSVVVVSLFASSALRHEYRNLSNLWKNEVLSQRKKKGTYRKKFTALLRHHPSDYLLQMYAARQATFAHPWRPKEALKHLEIAQFLNPSAGDILIFRGYILSRLKVYPQASIAFGRAVDLDISMMKPATKTIMKFGFLAEAIKQNQSKILTRYLLYKYQSLHPSGRELEELATFVTKRYPKLPAGYHILALFYLNKYTYEQAHTLKMRRLLKRQAKQSLRPITLTMTQRRWLEKINQKAPTKDELASAEALTSYFQSHLSVHHKRAAEWEVKLRRILQRIKTELPQLESLVLLLKGYIARQKQKLPQAKRAFSKILLEHDTYHWKAFFALFQIILAQKDNDGMVRWLGFARRHFRTAAQRAYVYYLEGLWWEKNHEYRRAMSLFGDALRLQTKDRFMLALGRTCEEVGMHQCALRNYRQLMGKPRYRYLQEKVKFLLARPKRTPSP